MAKCNQLTPLPFKGSINNTRMTLTLTPWPLHSTWPIKKTYLLTKNELCISH